MKKFIVSCLLGITLIGISSMPVSAHSWCKGRYTTVDCGMGACVGFSSYGEKNTYISTVCTERRPSITSTDGWGGIVTIFNKEAWIKVTYNKYGKVETAVGSWNRQNIGDSSTYNSIEHTYW